MVKIQAYAAAIGIVAASIAAPAHAAWDCESSINEIKSSRTDISYGLKRYVNCMTNSDGTDDCSTEFRRLKSAQDDYEGAVSGLQIYCR